MGLAKFQLDDATLVVTGVAAAGVTSSSMTQERKQSTVAANAVRLLINISKNQLLLLRQHDGSFECKHEFDNKK